jgi:hypothetical protein
MYNEQEVQDQDPGHRQIRVFAFDVGPTFTFKVGDHRLMTDKKGVDHIIHWRDDTTIVVDGKIFDHIIIRPLREMLAQQGTPSSDLDSADIEGWRSFLCLARYHGTCVADEHGDPKVEYRQVPYDELYDEL